MKTLYQAIKDCINSHVREYVMGKGGEVVLPKTEYARINLDFYGDEVDHELLALRVTEEGIVVVESVVDGERQDDNFSHFSNEEMWQIATKFLPKE